MKLLFEYKDHNKSQSLLPALDVNKAEMPEALKRKAPLRIPNISENELTRHYTELEENTFGVNNGFYPLGSCTMKYNPKINDEIIGLPGFAKIHPLQPVETVQGALEALHVLEGYLCEITGMDNMTFQPAAGAQGEYLGLSIIKAYHVKNGDIKRNKIIVPESAHGTNPASVTMVGCAAVSVATREDGRVDLEKLKAAVGDDTAGLMLTNPNTLGLFENDILEMADIVHKAGGLLYYDGANLNPIMGVARPGDMGFDVVHLNLHKTFSTPHGGGGPGSGPVGCKKHLEEFLPVPRVVKTDEGYGLCSEFPNSLGHIKNFYGHFSVCLKALAYVTMLGHEGIKEAAEASVINANYFMKGLSDIFDIAGTVPCMHEFVVSMDNMNKKHGVSAKDFAKSLLDYNMHPPTIYFPLCVKEALMIEPTETESKDALDEAIAVYRKLHKEAIENPEKLQNSPYTTKFKRLDEVGAARNPRTKYNFDN